MPYTILTDLHYLPCLPPSPSRPVPLPLLVLLPPLPLPSSPRNALFSATQPSARSTPRQHIAVPYLDDLTTPLVDGHLTLRRLSPYENSSSQTQAGTLCQCRWPSYYYFSSLLSRRRERARASSGLVWFVQATRAVAIGSGFFFSPPSPPPQHSRADPAMVVARARLLATV